MTPLISRSFARAEVLAGFTASVTLLLAAGFTVKESLARISAGGAPATKPAIGPPSKLASTIAPRNRDLGAGAKRGQQIRPRAAGRMVARPGEETTLASERHFQHLALLAARTGDGPRTDHDRRARHDGVRRVRLNARRFCSFSASGVHFKLRPFLGTSGWGRVARIMRLKHRLMRMK